MTIRRTALIFLFLCHIKLTKTQELGFIKDLKGGACYAYLVEDIHTKKQYVFKQGRKKDLSLYRDAIMEYVWSKVAQLVGIETNSVEFINQNFLSPEKSHQNTLATLHSYIDAVDGSQAKQSFEPCLSGPWNHLTYSTILQRSDLAKIAALDLVSGNADRHKDNMLYEPEKDLYIAIDFGYSSRSMRIKDASSFFKRISEQSAHCIKLSANQKESLISFTETLKELCDLINKKHIQYIFIEAMEKSTSFGAPLDIIHLLYELFSLQLIITKKESLKIIKYAEMILNKSK